MKAIVCTKIGTSLEEALQYLSYETVPVPEPNADQIQIQVKAAALNFFDGLILQNKYQYKFSPPFIPGSEFAGIITKIGSKIKNFNVGDHVIGLSEAKYGAFAEYTITIPPKLWKINKNMNFIDASAFAITYGTAYMSMVQRAKINENGNNKNILVTAASGALGTACLQLSKVYKCKNIIACVGNNKKKTYAYDCGATHVINYNETPQWSKEVKKILNGKGLDVVADMVGGKTFDEALSIMNWYGKMLVLGFTGGKIQQIPANKILLKSIDVIGVAWGATALKDYSSFRNSIQDCLNLYDKQKLKPIIGNIYQLNTKDVKQCYIDLMSRKSVGKLVINIGNDDSNDNNDNNNNNIKSKL